MTTCYEAPYALVCQQPQNHLYSRSYLLQCELSLGSTVHVKEGNTTHLLSVIYILQCIILTAQATAMTAANTTPVAIVPSDTAS